MRSTTHGPLLALTLLWGCASSVKYDNTFAGPGADQPLFLPSRIKVFAPELIEVADRKFESRFLTRGNRVEADSFALGIVHALGSKGISVDLRRYAERTISETADIRERIAGICSSDTSRYSLVVGLLRIVDNAQDQNTPCALQKGAILALGRGCVESPPAPSLRVEIQLYDHRFDKISRTLKFGTDSRALGITMGLYDFHPFGFSPMTKPILKELADTVRVR